MSLIRALRSDQMVNDHTRRSESCSFAFAISLHGKEGVDGSSPSEGLGKVRANRHFCVVCL